ncbi:MAG: hypothetical protein HY233_13430 [Acidobacteriales bacterium]|nr:hypothetical protein [Candidatus Koribacter versatilis]MBI3646943.1 hypothetical protein [Terriglobales bacterium]
MCKPIATLVLSVLLVGNALADKPMRQLDPKEKQELTQYLKSHWQTPEDYVVGKFVVYDLVFLGEQHLIKHNLELVQNLIPRLYRAGVYNLGIEFGEHAYQAEVDRLITADTYDENLARWLMFKFKPDWGYKEYMDIYRAAWALNHSLPKDSRKFRVVNLGPRIEYRFMKQDDRISKEDAKKIFPDGDFDEFMAQTILTDFVAKGQKALIYSGAHHSFTRYKQSAYDWEARKFLFFVDSRMGNIVYRQVPDKVFTIILHYPWWSRKALDDVQYPVGGAIDSVMSAFKDQRVGFDVKGSPFGKLRDPDTAYSSGYDDFALSTFTDGYIFLGPFREYEGCTVDPEFITAENLQEAMQSPMMRKVGTTREELLKAMQKDADMRTRFKDF